MRRLLTTSVLACAAIGLAAPAASAADACPNAAYRTGAGANLPDCRAWEQATPPDKGGNAVKSVLGAFPSPSGDRVLLGASGDVGGAEAVPYNGVFSSVRGLDWTTRGLDPPIDARPAEPFDPILLVTLGISDDRAKVFVVTPRRLTPEAVEGATNFYFRDTSSGAYTFAGSVPGDEFYSTVASADDLQFVGGSSNFDYVALRKDYPATPGALTGANNLYVIGGGRVALASRDEAGEAIAVTNPQQPNMERAVSNDGRRVVFQGQFRSGLFQRVDGESTVLISHSRVGGADPTVGASVSAYQPSPDGRSVTFVSDPGLTEEAPASPFYRWDAGPGDGTLVNLLNGITPPWSANASNFVPLRISTDRRYIWFTVKDTDEPNGPTFTRLELLDTKERSIRTLLTSADDAGTPLVALNPGTGQRAARFSPDGSEMVMLSARSLTSYDQQNAACVFNNGACAEAFAFSADRPESGPVCVSCEPQGTRSVGDASIDTSGYIAKPESNVITDDGHMLFDTPQPLAPTDANGLADVYENVPGRSPALISSGSGSSPARVLGLSASGRDAFFFSSDSLVAQDDDGAVDIYDARVDGGIASQQVPPNPTDPCAAATCRGPLTLAAPPAAAGSLTFRSPARAPNVRFRVARVSSAARRRAAATGRLAISVEVGATGKVSALATARIRGRSVSVGRVSATARRGGRFTLRLALSASAQKALQREGTLKLALRVSYSKVRKPASQSVSLAIARARSSSQGGAR